MARETAMQRNARLDAERRARLEQEQAAYPARLMAVLERVSAQPRFELSVRNGFFVVNDRDSRYDVDYQLAYSWSNDTQSALENLEWKLEDLEAEQAEQRRRASVRESAKRKALEVFSEEERELLGL